MNPPISPGLPPAWTDLLKPKSCRTSRPGVVTRLLTPSQPGSRSNRSVLVVGLSPIKVKETTTSTKQIVRSIGAHRVRMLVAESVSSEGEFTLRFILILAAGLLFLSVGYAEQGPPRTKIVLVAGTASHGPGEHEFNAGVTILADCL